MKRYFVKGIVVAVAALTVLSYGVATQVSPVFADECQAGANVNGNNNPNILNGGPLNNVMHGFGGNDIMRGFGCNDQIYGEAGDDKIDGGPGWDYCNGGPGVDVFANCEVVVP